MDRSFLPQILLDFRLAGGSGIAVVAGAVFQAGAWSRPSPCVLLERDSAMRAVWSLSPPCSEAWRRVRWQSQWVWLLPLAAAQAGELWQE